MSYQGRLTDSSGQPVRREVTVTFSFHETESGGEPLLGFTDSDQVLPDNGGNYSTVIGDDGSNPIPLRSSAGRASAEHQHQWRKPCAPPPHAVVGNAMNAGTACAIANTFTVSEGAAVEEGQAVC
jgi:hypothetical protein